MPELVGGLTREAITPENQIIGGKELVHPLGRLSRRSQEIYFSRLCRTERLRGLVGTEVRTEEGHAVCFWLSEPLSWLLNKLQSILGLWFGHHRLTILVKLLLWPLTAKATRSQKNAASRVPWAN